jgi:hypothetical protein
MSLDESRLSRIRTPLLLVSVAVLVWAALGALDVGNFTYSGYATDGNNTITRVTEGGPADRAGLQTGDYVRSIGGIAVENTRALAQRQRPAINEVRSIEVERDGRTVDVELSYAPLPVSNVLVAYGAIVVGILFLACGVWAFLVSPSRETLLLAALGVSFSIGFTAGPYFSAPTVRTAVGLVVLLLIIVGLAVLTHFLLVFPKPKRALERRSSSWILYGPAVVVGLLTAWLVLAQPPATSATNVFFRVLFGLLLVGYFGAALVALIHSYVKTGPRDRAASGLNLLLIGTIVGLGPTLIISIVGLIAPQVVVPGASFLPLALGLIPVAFALAAVKGERAAPAAG